MRREERRGGMAVISEQGLRNDTGESGNEERGREGDVRGWVR